MSDVIRLLPHSLDAERAVLGAILLHPPALYQATEIIGKSDFYMEAHRRIFDAVLRLQKSETAIDALTCKTELRRTGELDAVGGAAYVLGLTDGIPGVINVRHYAAIVRETSVLRRIIRLGSESAEKAYDARESSKEIVDAMQVELIHLVESSRRGGWLKIADLVQEAYNELDALSHRKAELAGIDTGFRDLNVLTQGFKPGELIVIAGRPGHGKTSLGLNLIATALKADKRVGLFTIEMSAREITKRILCAEGEVDSHRVAAGCIGKDDWRRIGEAAGRLAETNLYVDESGSLTITDLRSRAQQLALAGGCDMLVVDYLQLMAGPHHRGDFNRVQEISDVSRCLKALAKDLKVPVVAMSQLNREVERESKRRPRLADLRESGSIEQDADLVLFIWREELRGATEDNRGQAELIIGKQRNGPVGETVDLTFVKQYTKFVGCSKREAQAAGDAERGLWYRRENQMGAGQWWTKLVFEDLDRDCGSLSLAARGAWVWMFEYLKHHEGRQALSLEGWARVIRASTNQAATVLAELFRAGTCDWDIIENAATQTVTEKVTPENVTRDALMQKSDARFGVRCRRQIRLSNQHLKRNLRQQRYRERKARDAR